MHGYFRERITPVTSSEARLLRGSAWCGIAMAVLFGIGFMPFANFFPPPAPSATGAEVVDLFRANATSIRIGTVLMLVAITLIIPWGIGLTFVTSRIKPFKMILVAGQLVSFGIAVALIGLVIVMWSVAAFRAGSINPDVTQTLNDLAWIILLFTWPPFSLWCALVAMSILGDNSERPAMPRWCGYFGLFTAVSFACGGLVIFFKHGPFAWNGIIGFYIPLNVFFIWIIVVTVLLLRTAKRYSATEQASDLSAAPLSAQNPEINVS